MITNKVTRARLRASEFIAVLGTAQPKEKQHAKIKHW